MRLYRAHAEYGGVLLLLVATCKVESFQLPPSPSWTTTMDRRFAAFPPRTTSGASIGLFPSKSKGGGSGSIRRHASETPLSTPASSSSYSSSSLADEEDKTIWETVALQLVDIRKDPSRVQDYVQMISILRVGFPALGLATLAHVLYTPTALLIADWINDADVFNVVANDLSQYIQNILTTSGLVFSLLVGQTYYFMYQQQEAIYLALFEEVTTAKSLLEQIALVCQGRETLYNRILACVDRYVREDLTRFNDEEPAVILSARPDEDPLEDVLYLTSVGEPSIVYQTVQSLRRARAYRLGALQRKLPPIHMTLLWVLFGIVLFTFPLLGAGSQTLGGPGILTVQSWYISFIVFGMSLTMGVVYELQRPAQNGAYNARTVLDVMVGGLQEELDLRLNGDIGMPFAESPSVDADGYFSEEAPEDME